MEIIFDFLSQKVIIQTTDEFYFVRSDEYAYSYNLYARRLLELFKRNTIFYSTKISKQTPD